MNNNKSTPFLDQRTLQTATLSVLPPSIIPVVFLSGSDYQMGFQYGQQAGPYIETIKDASC